MHHHVLEAIVRRQMQGSIPGKRQDDYKIALAIEGGAMRGVVSSGMVAGLEYLGLLPAFDVVYGTSAGAINGAYFVSGQAAYGTSIYYENINNPQFFSPLRWLAGERPVSLEFLFEHVMVHEKPLNWRRVLDSQVELVPVAALLSKATAVGLRGARSRYGLFLRLKASARIPLLAGPPVCVNGEDYLDGDIFAPVPFRQALDEGCTHVLALLTRPSGTPLGRPSFLNRYIFSKKLAQYNSLLANALRDRVNRYTRELDWLKTQTCAPDCRPYVCAVSPPPGTALIGRFERRPERLVDGARCGMATILDIFGHRDTSCTELLNSNRQSSKRLAPLLCQGPATTTRPTSISTSRVAIRDLHFEQPAQHWNRLHAHSGAQRGLRDA
jgi:predicted patatin/cPLA2 family phospholipase